MTEPILFLDIDGVLNSFGWYRRRTSRGAPRELDELDPAAVALLDSLVREAGCLVVVSSTWRLLHSIPEIREFLTLKGFSYPGRIIDRTPDGASREHGPLWEACQRGAEIQMWREDKGHTGPFAVLDDSTDMDDVLEHFVQTTMEHGLQAEHVAQCVELLSQRETPTNSTT